jgi:hypothetical protein
MDSWLRNKKSFIIVWLIILAIVITVLITQIVLPIFVNKAIHHGGNGAWLLPYNKNTAKASMILSYLALGFVPLPFLFLLTTWIIGINGVARSRTFHYVLWFLLSLSILCMIISIGCGGYVLNDCNSWISS